MTPLKLNCDLGEGYGAWSLGDDAEIMPLIDQANIACGFHAGDPSTILSTLQYAKQYKVTVGCHPSYPDRVGFGRRSMSIAPKDLYADVLYQTSALVGMAKSLDLSVSYLKPHGALYHDMLANSETFQVLLRVAQNHPSPLQLMVPAGATTSVMIQQAASADIKLIFEAFADRRYTRHKTLVPRTQEGAVLSKAEMLAQTKQLMSTGTITSDCGTHIALQAHTLCVHGDTPSALAALRELRTLVTPDVD